MKDKTLINQFIKFNNLFVIDENGDKLGVISKREALNIAEEKGLDLVLISNNIKNPVAKIIDYGKYKYQLKKKNKVNKQNQNTIENKEIRLKLNIGVHDMQFKAKKVIEFIKNNSRVKISLKFRGREAAFPQFGHDKIMEFYKMVEEYADIDIKPIKRGLFLDMYVVPKRNKKK